MKWTCHHGCEYLYSIQLTLSNKKKVSTKLYIYNIKRYVRLEVLIIEIILDKYILLCHRN